MSRRSFYLGVSEAPAQKTRQYEDAYGPDVYEVNASVMSAPIMKVFVPADQVDNAISWALTMRDMMTDGISFSRAQWDALTEEEREALQTH